jgi:AAA15 family ATPase/GTPase
VGIESFAFAKILHNLRFQLDFCSGKYAFMLIQFTVGNFKSFKEKATLSMEATTDDSLEEANVGVIGERRLLKSVALFGPNAGGKSNFLQAMKQFRNWVMNSSKNAQSEEPIPVVPFRLHTETETAPSFFEAIFLHKESKYRYGFEATSVAVTSEWLFSQKDSIRETRLFTREREKIGLSESFKEGNGLENRTRPNALFLSVVAQFNGPISIEIMSWMNHFRDVPDLDEDYSSLIRYTANRLKEREYAHLIRELARKADTGIERLEAQDLAPEAAIRMLPKPTPDNLRHGLLSGEFSAFSVKTYHRKYGPNEKQQLPPVEFDLKLDESAGTQRFVALTGPFLFTLKHGAILFSDELEARLHPTLTKALVSMFNSSANTKNAQLIFATHGEGLLDPKRIRRDQIWFVEKDRFGASRLYSLAEFKGVRKQAKFAKEYLLGQFGAVPHIGDFEEVITHGGE